MSSGCFIESWGRMSISGRVIASDQGFRRSNIAMLRPFDERSFAVRSYTSSGRTVERVWPAGSIIRIWAFIIVSDSMGSSAQNTSLAFMASVTTFGSFVTRSSGTWIVPKR